MSIKRDDSTQNQCLNVTSHISFQQKQTSQAIFPSTRGHGRTKFFQNPDGRETTLTTGHHHDNKRTYEANNLCCLTFKVFQKHTFFSHNTFATAIAEKSRRQNGSSPKRQRRTVLDRTLHVLCFKPADFFLRDLSLCNNNIFVR